ncbi:MAG TPA: hypothetical protein VLE73_03935 [Candidatus Saccharimonadales bacterium]|nr:hypothetical protein [Candidatus Saccharimonadales bacterium]
MVTRELPHASEVRYPVVQQKLLRLMAEDQDDRLSGRFLSNDPKKLVDLEVAKELHNRDIARSEELRALLQVIKSPNARNIGLDGSRAVWLLANHSPLDDITKMTLTKMRRIYYKDKSQVFYPGIPYLVDYLMLKAKAFDHMAKQSYGTRYYYTKYEGGDSTVGNFPIINETGLAERRKKFGLTAQPSFLRKCDHQNGRTATNTR